MFTRLCLAAAAWAACVPAVHAETVAEARLRFLRGDNSAVTGTLMVAAQAGHSEAMNLIGSAFQYGEGVEANPEQALAWFSRSAQAGWPHAYANLGDIYADGELGLDADPIRARDMFEAGLRVDFDGAVAIEYAAWLRKAEPPIRDEARALRLVEEAAAMGKMRALGELGYFYAEGIMVEQDYARAMALFEQADQQGHPKSARNLGFMHDEGIGVAENDALALEYYLRAGRAGDKEGMADAASLLWFGSDTVTPDQSTALDLAQRAMTRRSPKGFEFMGDRAYYGQGIPEDRVLAIDYYTQAWEIGGRAYSAYALGWQYANGDGIEQDIPRGAAFYRRAAELGRADAAAELGGMIHDGDVDGTTEEMLALLNQAAEADNRSAINELGLVYDFGSGVPRDVNRALAYYEQAAALGDPWAKRNVGLVLLNDMGTPSDADIQRAEALFREAAADGVASAYSSLAVLYEEGIGRDVDADEAIRLYKRAGDEGDGHGYIDAASVMLAGDPGPIDIVRARTLLNQAAQEDAHALQHLGDFHREGAFGAPNLSKAYEMYQGAFDQVRDADAAARIAEMGIAGESPVADGIEAGVVLSLCLYATAEDSEFAPDCAPLRAGLTPQIIADAEARAAAY